MSIEDQVVYEFDPKQGYKVRRCKYCGKEITWVNRDEEGRKINVDPDPVLVNCCAGRESFYSIEYGWNHEIIGRRATPEEIRTNRANLWVGFVPHSHTCPEPHDW